MTTNALTKHNIMSSIAARLDRQTADRKNRVAKVERRRAVNVTEHNGELWICHHGEPVVPLARVKYENIETLMEECRRGWESYKKDTDI